MTGTLDAGTGKTPTVTLSKNGGAFASPAGAVTELANGWYSVAGNATDSGTLGPLLLHATAADCDPTDEVFEVVAYDPALTSLGLSLAKTTNITGFNDIAATAVVSGGAITTSGGAVSTVTAVTNGVTLAAGQDVRNVTGTLPSVTVGDKTGFSLAGTTTTLDALQTALNTAHGAGSWATATGFAVAGDAMTLEDGAITEAKIATPAESAGRPTGILAMVRRVFEWHANKRTRSRATGTVLLRNAADDGTLETQTQSTSGASGSETDVQTKGV